MKSAVPRIELPPQVPVMFLSGVVLLPHVLLPLYIFEPRYREMLAYALEHERMFCVALMKPGVDEVRGPDDFFPDCGLGLVRACVGHDDGTSHLILQGLARVRLRGFVRERPFRVAEVSELPASGGTPENCQPLAAKLRSLCTALTPGSEHRERLEEQIAQITEPAMLADVVAHTFLREVQRQQEVLTALDIEERLRLVIRHLREESAA